MKEISVMFWTILKTLGPLCNERVVQYESEVSLNPTVNDDD